MIRKAWVPFETDGMEFKQIHIQLVKSVLPVTTTNWTHRVKRRYPH